MLAFTACAGEEAKNDKSGDVSVNTPSAEESADAGDGSSDLAEDDGNKAAGTGNPQTVHKFQDVLDEIGEDEKACIAVFIKLDLPEDEEKYVEEKTYEITGLREEDITDAMSIEEAQNFIRTQRKVRSDLYGPPQEKFVNEVVIPNGGTNAISMSFTRYISFEATKSEAEAILDHPDVVGAYIVEDQQTTTAGF